MTNPADKTEHKQDTLKQKWDGWQNRVKERLKALNMTQETLAKKIGVTRSAISHYMSGRRIPSLSQFSRLAEVLEANPGWLQFGSPDETPAEKVSRLMAALHPVPILSCEQAFEFTISTKLHTLKIQEWVPNYFIQGGKHVYGLKIKGDAMISPNGQNKSLHEGDIIVVNYNAIPDPGDFVVAKLLDTKEVTVKQYVVDAGKRYLKPLNPQYPTIEITNNIGGLALVTHTISPNTLDDGEVTISYEGMF